MVTGVETTGILLAILPLFVEGAKIYKSSIHSARQARKQSQVDKALEEFYDSFYCEIVAVNYHVDNIYDFLLKSIDPDILPRRTDFLSKWKNTPAIQCALRTYFGSDRTVRRFTIISRKIVQHLNSLINDKTTKLSNEDKDEKSMYLKLDELIRERELRSTQTPFRDRWRFIRRTEDRDTFLRNLRICRKELGKLLSPIEQQYNNADQHREEGDIIPKLQARVLAAQSTRIHDLISDLYNVMGQCWNCGCSSTHDVKFLLEDVSDGTISSIDFFVFADTPSASRCWWQEARVYLMSDRNALDLNSGKIDRICELLKPSNKGLSLNFRVQDINGQQRMWKLPTTPRHIKFDEAEDPASLEQIFDGPSKMATKQKLQLSLTLAYSLLHYHSSQWLSRGWKKNRIFFFFDKRDEPIYTRPYLSFRFNLDDADSESEDKNLRLCNESILSLGIILLEIHEEKPIEKWRNQQQKDRLREMGSSQREQASFCMLTDWEVAERVVEGLDPNGTREAVEACFQWNREPQSRISLETNEARAELCKRIITPLERDLESLEKVLKGV